MNRHGAWILVLTIVGALGALGCGPANCVRGSEVIPHGQGVEHTDGCNSCTCNDGTLICTTMACVQQPTSD